MELENKDPTAEPVSLPLGFLRSITDDFCHERELGRGACGVVYKGILPCGSVIAVKKFDERILMGDDRSFKDEASFLMDIEHQNVVQLLGYCAESSGVLMKQPNRKGIVLEQLTRMLCFEYMCNGCLDEHLSDESSGLEWNTRYKIIKGICSGLKYLHERNIIHRDLKPQNILLDITMVPKVADFGLSRLLGEQKSYVVTSNLAGTLGYMAPEYIIKGEFSKRADIFSLGVIIIEILKGCRDGYPDYHLHTKTDFQHFTDKVLSNWRNRFERPSKYTSPELHTRLVKQCIDIALECVHPDKEKRPDVSNIIEILNAAEKSCYDQNGECLPVHHQMGTQEGLPTSGVLRALNKIALKDHAQVWAKGMTKSAVALAPHQPQREPALDGYQVARSASFWVAHNALASLESNLLKAWAATNNVAPNINLLELELISVKAILESTLGRVIHSSVLEHSLMILQDLVYDAENVVDEMEYFRIHDMLDTSQHVGAHNLDLNVLPSISDEPQEMIFDRVDASNRMKHIVEQMQEVRQRISGIMTHLGSNWSTFPNIAQNRPISISESIEPKLYGRELMMKSIIHDVTKGKHSGEVLTVIPIVGQGGIGKTTLAQHIYHSGEVQQHFDVRVWTCVSLNFNVNNLTEEIQRCIPKVDGESSNATATEIIGQRLKDKRLLLVLDDIWDCSDEDEWKRLLVPFQKSQLQGNIIIVTTRFPAQAKIMVQKKDQSIFLQGLENKEFEELFLEIIFGDDDDQSRKDHAFLLETGSRIADRLKGSPLAAKTVGRLLKTKLDLDHWTRILESKEWEHSNGKNDIMPALKLSFDYLPPPLQQCFSYCALFPQDYRFRTEQLINFWIGIDALHSSHGENRRVENIGLSHLTQLVNYGFFNKEGKGDGSSCCYIIHDLLHELACKVSSHECLSIVSSQSQVSSIQVLSSVRHLSINIDEISVKDRLTQKNCVEGFSTLDKRINVEKLRSLMLFGEHQNCFVKSFGYLFREARALRVVFLSKASYSVEDLLPSFYTLIHLRYLRIESSSLYEARFPIKISGFYHMVVLDAKHCDIIDVPRDMSNLVKLRHFLVRNDAIHSSISEVGKLKSLQELRRFAVKQGHGFELREIGHLVEICGSLSICNLENVQVKEEAEEAKLIQKNHLHELILHWNNQSGISNIVGSTNDSALEHVTRSTNDSALEEHVLERLKPSSNLRKLSIIGHGGDTGPSWLGINLSVKNLESLCLDNVAWRTLFPPIGELWLANVPCKDIAGNVPDKRFENLRRLELVNLLSLKRWSLHAPCQLFPFLEVLVISGCSNLVEISFSHSTCCQKEKGAYKKLVPRLSQLSITNCPQLLSFPPVPWTDAPCFIEIKGTGHSPLNELVCYDSYRLKIMGNGNPDSTLWNQCNVLDFDNLTRLEKFELKICKPLPLHRLQMLSSLRTLVVHCLSDALPFGVDDSQVEYHFPVESLIIKCRWIGPSGKELTQLLTYFPKLSDLELSSCHKITGLGVIGQLPKEEIATLAAEELLLLPPRLQRLEINSCHKLSIVPRGGGLQSLSSLRRLFVCNCPKLLSSYSSTSLSTSEFPFPNSLEYLNLLYVEGMPVPLSNLISLTWLSIFCCGDLICKGLLSLLVQGHLTELHVKETPRFFDVFNQELPSGPLKLQVLGVDDVAGFSAIPTRSLVFSSLATLHIYFMEKMERFTEEQESILFVSSLNAIELMYCRSLQYLPARLHTLPNLKKLRIEGCEAIEMLPAGVFPSSLQELVIDRCPKIRSLTKDCLPSSLQRLEIRKCPGIRSLPTLDDLPTSLQGLYVHESKCEELRRQCHKFKGIIPTVEA